MGNQTYVDITIEVDARMDVGESHCITDNIEAMLRKKIWNLPCTHSC